MDQDTQTLLYRMQSMEQQIKQVQEQLKAYVPARENELQLRNIQEAVTRIERDMTAIRTKQEEFERETQKRDEEQKASQSALQIRVLWGVISSLIFAGTGILVGYVTHFFH